MSVSEGQPVLTPEAARRWASEARLATHLDDHLWANRMTVALDALAREREARAMDATDAERELDEALDARIQAERFAQELEGRVRELREALVLVSRPPGSFADSDALDLLARIRVAREALVGLPDA